MVQHRGSKFFQECLTDGIVTSYKLLDKQQPFDLQSGGVVILDFWPVLERCTMAFQEAADHLKVPARLQLRFDPLGYSTVFSPESVHYAKELFKTPDQGTILLKTCLRSAVDKLSDPYADALAELSTTVSFAKSRPKEFLQKQGVTDVLYEQPNSINIPFTDIFQKEVLARAAATVHGLIQRTRLAYSGGAGQLVASARLEEFWEQALKDQWALVGNPESNILMNTCRFKIGVEGEVEFSQNSTAAASLSALEDEWLHEKKETQTAFDTARSEAIKAINEYLTAAIKVVASLPDGDMLALEFVRIVNMPDIAAKMVAIESVCKGRGLPSMSIDRQLNAGSTLSLEQA